MDHNVLERVLLHLGCKLAFLLAWGLVLKAINLYLAWLALDGTEGEIYRTGVLVLDFSVLGIVVITAIRDVSNELMRKRENE